jgi:hypothetical protein
MTRQQELLVGLVVPATAGEITSVSRDVAPIDVKSMFPEITPTPRRRQTRRPAPIDDPLTVALRQMAHIDRQLAAVRVGLERMARGRDELIRRAARKLLRTMMETP